MLKITIYPLQNADCFAVCPVFWVIDLTWCECSDSVCPVRALRIYIDRSASFRQSDQLSCVLRWLCEGPYQNRGFPLDCVHIRVYSTRVIASCAWLRGMSIQEIYFAAGWSSQNTLPGFTIWTVSPWPPKCCRWVTIHVYATSIHMCLLPHTVITLCSPFMLLLLLSALYSVQLQLYNIYSIGVPSCLCRLLFNTVISVQPSHNAVVFASALFLSAAYVITDQICKFRTPGL